MDTTPAVEAVELDSPTPDLAPVENPEQVARQQRHIERYNTGSLRYDEYKKLPTYAKALYKRTFGVPKNEGEQVNQRRAVAKRHAAKKAARKSRRRNRA